MNDVLSKYVPPQKEKNAMNPWSNKLFFPNALKRKDFFRIPKKNGKEFFFFLKVRCWKKEKKKKWKMKIQK